MRARNLFLFGFFSSTTLLLAQLLIFFVSNSSFFHANALNSSTKNARETIEIIIGGGPPSNGYYPQPPTPCPPPPPPPIEPPCPPPPPIEPPCPPPPSHPPPPTPSHPPPPPPTHPPPPPPRPSPSPPPPPNSRPPINPELGSAIEVIKKFRKTIINDPFGITKTWVGNDLCRDKTKYLGYICYNNKLVGIKFNGYNFNGNKLSINNFIENLKTLVIFHVNSNNFTGQIPTISSLKIPKLFELDLSNNKLVGSFPKSVLGATNLTYLDIRFNQYTGSVDPDVFKMDLDVLFLNNNQFSGQIPETFGLSHALFINLANNKFSGQLPKSIGQGSKYLLEVLFLNNKLSGCLPYEIGKLNLASVFDVSMNELTGPIPESFGGLEEMQLLNLAQNKFYGTVPESVCKLSHLEKLTLKDNYFTQVGPECRKIIKENILDISMNCISGLENQRNPEACSAFFSQHSTCPDMNSLNDVPSKIDESSSRENSGRGHRKTKTHSTTYAALDRHYDRRHHH